MSYSLDWLYHTLSILFVILPQLNGSFVFFSFSVVNYGASIKCVNPLDPRQDVNEKRAELNCLKKNLVIELKYNTCL